MILIAGTNQCISKRLPDLRITRIFLDQLGKVWQDLLYHPAMTDQVMVGMQASREIPIQDLSTCCQ